MMRVQIAAFQNNARVALRLLLINLEMQVVGESADWSTTLQLAEEVQPEILLIDCELIPLMRHNLLAPVRWICPTTKIIVLINGVTLPHYATLSAEADLVLSKSDMPDQIANRILALETRSAN